MKFNRIFVIIAGVFLSATLTACGAPQLSNWPGIASDGEKIYLAAGQEIYQVQASNGQEVMTKAEDGTSLPLRFPPKSRGGLFSFNSPPPAAFYGTPLLTPSGQLVFGDASTLNTTHTLYSIDPSANAVKWTFVDAKGIWLAGPAFSTNAIYAAAGDGKVYAIDLDGKKLWTAAISDHELWSTPVTDDKLVYVTTLDHEVIALDSQTGEQRWNSKLDNAIVGTPALGADGTLYVGTLSGNLYALKTVDGSQVWLTKLEGNIWSTPAIDNTTLYVGTSNGTAGKLYAINSADGKFVRAPLDEAGAVVARPLITQDQIIYVTEDGFIKFLNKDGTPNGPGVKIENAKIYTSPLLVGDLIVVAPMNTQFMLAAYNQKGVQQWTFTPAP